MAMGHQVLAVRYATPSKSSAARAALDLTNAASITSNNKKNKKSPEHPQLCFLINAKHAI
jgi:hypothetical protein